MRTFLSTLSLRRATILCCYYIFDVPISIHALLAESDDWQNGEPRFNQIFLSTLSLRRATKYYHGENPTINISIHALLAESDGTPHAMPQHLWISIHALLAESDTSENLMVGEPVDFYPRSPCGERPLCCKQISGLWRISINALLAESDSTFLKLACIAARISIHALLAESDADCMDILKGIPISIHALLAESDTTCPCSWKSSSLFLSTLSLRRATAGNGEYNAREKYFYPRSPCGERRIQAQTAILMSSISIHALLAESDVDNNLTL